MINHLILFIIYLFPQAMCINGIWLSAQGTTEIKPDGTEHDGDMIFYKLAKYLNQRTMAKVYYSGDMREELVQRIYATFPTLTSWLPSDEEMFYWKKQREGIERTFDIKIKFKEKTVLFYREYSNYKFSKYIRKPIFGCVICMSSFWGIFTFLLPALCYYHFDPVVFAIYIPNTFCLAYLNYKIMKPL